MGDVALLNKHRALSGHIFEQRRRRLDCLRTGEIARKFSLPSTSIPGDSIISMS